jgi:acetyl esterase/lipase
VLKKLSLRVAAVALAIGLIVPAAAEAAPARYLDEVFASVDVTTDLTYGSAPDLQGTPVALKLDLYQPSGDTASRRPAIVWVHGGGFAVGSKRSGRNFATSFARRGYVVVSIDYRLLVPPGCGGQLDPRPECEAAALAAQHDAQAAVRWLRANAATYRIDPTRVVMAGSSAGAITSLLTAWRSEDPGDSGNPGLSSEIAAAVSVSGGTPTNEFIGKGDAPAIFFHGTQDRTVAYSWAVSNVQAMREAGIRVELVPFAGAGHGLFGSGYRGEIYERTTRFLYDVLSLSRANLTKQDCKNGGWRQLGFKNQGRCIASVGGPPSRTR